MRKLLCAVLVALLAPAALAAQGPPTTPGSTRAKTAQPGDDRPALTADQAKSGAIARVRSDLAAGRLNGGYPFGKQNASATIRPDNILATGVLFNPTGGKNGIYVVGVTAPGSPGHVRVLIDAKTGAVLDSKVGSFQWGVTSPDWWVKGLSAPPAAKKGEDTLSVKAR